jgi:hypothetical protein
MFFEFESLIYDHGMILPLSFNLSLSLPLSFNLSLSLPLSFNLSLSLPLSFNLFYVLSMRMLFELNTFIFLYGSTLSPYRIAILIEAS